MPVEHTHLHVIDRGDGRTVVVLQGDDGDASDFMGPLLARVAYDFRTLLIDRPGCGGSERSRNDFALDAQTRVIRLALRELGAEQPLLVAHSWSAVAALALALRYPDDFAGLVLINPLCYPDASIRATDPQLRVVSRLGSLVAPSSGAPRMTRPSARNFLPSQFRSRRRSCHFARLRRYDVPASDAVSRATPHRSAPPRDSSRVMATLKCRS